MLTLRPYQKDAVEFLRQKGLGYLMLDMGSGKTAIVIDWLKYTNGKVLIVAPLMTAWTTWPSELEKWKGPDYAVLHGAHKHLNHSARVHIINFDGLVWLKDALKTSKTRYRVLVVDEGSMLKNPSTKRVKAIRNILPMFKYRVILSGTPAPNSLLDLWAQYFILDHGARLGKAVTWFKRTYFKQGGFKGYQWFIKDGAADVIYKAIEDITYRIEVKNNLPSVTYNTIKVEIPKKAKKLYDTLKQDLVLQLSKEIKVAALFAGSLSSKLRQIVQGGLYTDEKGIELIHKEKLKALSEIIDVGHRVLCPIQFKLDLAIIRQKYPKTPYLGGGVPSKDKTDIIKAWNNKEIPLLVCHPASVGHGLNLQFGSNILVWYALPWSLEQYLQMNSRLHRPGQNTGVIVHHIIAAGTVDEAVFKALKNKEKVQQSLLDYFSG